MSNHSSLKIEGYKHHIGSHCESGTVRNLLLHAGVDITEQMVFGLGSGIAFYYLFFVKGPSGFPLVGIRTRPGEIVKNTAKLLNLNVVWNQYKTTDEALENANQRIAAGIPVALCVDMFYMKYLPRFIQVHAPFHFIILVGKDGDTYEVSDPYYNGIGRLSTEHLKAAWQTDAPMAKDNSLIYIEGSTKETVNLNEPVKKALKSTCANMLLPPVVRNIFSIVGIEGMRAYAKAMPTWSKKYRGVALREGILFNAIAFEDQGTGGGAFRLLYGAFLQEVAKLFDSSEIDALATRMIEHGNNWKEFSRKMIRLGKTVPMEDGAFEAWIKDNDEALDVGLKELSETFMTFADIESAFIKDMKVVLKQLA